MNKETVQPERIAAMLDRHRLAHTATKKDHRQSEMQPRTLDPIVFFSAVLLTAGSGITALWLALQNPQFADKLFYALITVFVAGAAAIVGLIRVAAVRGKSSDNSSFSPSPKDF
jgi:hypothetical protein